MKYLKIVIPLLVLLSLGFGCAAKSRISEMKQDTTITYTHAEKAQYVAVTVGAPYVYEDFIERRYKGVLVKGYLFKDADGTAILVTRLTRSDFEKLTEITLDAPMIGIKAYPPKTIYEDAFCQLVRAYVVAFEEEVVAAVTVKELNSEKKPCEEWASLDDIMSDHPEIVIEFDKSVDDAITMQWK